MEEREQILFMQIRMIRFFSERFNLPLRNIAEIFKEFAVLSFIKGSFGILHLEGDEAVFEEVYNYLKSKGVSFDEA